MERHRAGDFRQVTYDVPAWYGHRYPTMGDLVDFAGAMGCHVGYASIGEEAIYFPPDLARKEPPVILLPKGIGPLRACWLLAHELGHLVQHSGPKGRLFYGKEESQAKRWAACALIPWARIRHHGNASMDAMVAALSAHYEDLPLFDCEVRRLAGDIATIRLKYLTMEVA
jgi:Zn-dependent peptidase ImmA (M78 family)